MRPSLSGLILAHRKRAMGSCPLLFPSSIIGHLLCYRLIFRCHIFLPFHTVHGIFQAGILEGAAISFSSGSCFVRSLHLELSFSCGLVRHSSELH